MALTVVVNTALINYRDDERVACVSSSSWSYFSLYMIQIKKLKNSLLIFGYFLAFLKHEHNKEKNMHPSSLILEVTLQSLPTFDRQASDVTYRHQSILTSDRSLIDLNS